MVASAARLVRVAATVVRGDPQWGTDLDALERRVLGRPTPLQVLEVPGGRRLLLKREDLRRAGCVRSSGVGVVAQVLLAHWLGLERVITSAPDVALTAVRAAESLDVAVELYTDPATGDGRADEIGQLTELGVVIRLVSTDNLGQAVLSEWLANPCSTLAVTDPRDALPGLWSTLAGFERRIGGEARAQAMRLLGGLPSRVIAGAEDLAAGAPFFSTFAEDDVEFVAVSPEHDRVAAQTTGDGVAARCVTVSAAEADDARARMGGAHDVAPLARGFHLIAAALKGQCRDGQRGGDLVILTGEAPGSASSGRDDP